MSQTNGEAEVTNLSEAQLGMLNRMLSSYLQELTVIEARTAVINKTIADIAGAYLIGLGITQTMVVDLATGKLTPVDQPVAAPAGG